MASKLGSLSSRSAIAIISWVFTGVIIFNINAQRQALDFDFFYLILQWPGSYCDTGTACCYPNTGKPAADFQIRGLWPEFNDSTSPSDCDPSNTFDPSMITDLIDELTTRWGSLSCPSTNGNSSWELDWNEHGTCSETVLNQHDYFQAALLLRNNVDPLNALLNAGIIPNDNQYGLNSISQALTTGIGYTPGIECNTDIRGNPQLYQIYLCVNRPASGFIQCPVGLPSQCTSQNISFPTF